MAYHKKTESLVSKILRSRIVQFFLLILITAMGWQVYERYKVERTAAEKRQHAEAEFQTLQTHRDQLAAEVGNLHDNLGIEGEIRRNFDVAREGEEIVIILDNDLHTTPERVGPTAPEPIAPPARRPWYYFWH